MTWVESHTTLRDHWKLKRLCSLLGIDRVRGVGHLHLLWWWVITYAEDGDLSRFDASIIADAADWPTEDAERFLSALIEAGFLDSGPDGLWVHDWGQYAGRLMAERQRRRRWRERARARREQGDVTETTVAWHAPSHMQNVWHAGDVSVTCSSCDDDVTETSQSRDQDVTVRVRPNHTEPNQTEPYQTRSDTQALECFPPDGVPLDVCVVVDVWNEICASEQGPGPPLPRVLGVTRSRRNRFAVRLRELKAMFGEGVNDVGWWRALFERVRSSAFLRGEGASGWQASFDWLLEQSERIVRVLEGAYDPRGDPVDRSRRSPPNDVGLLDLPPSEFLRREREAILARKQRGEEL